MAKRARIAEIQYLRGFAFLAVVLQHTIGHYAYLPEAGLADGVILAVWLIAAKFAVPVFIFITGLVLFYNYSDHVPYGSFIWKRCKDIVLPYAVWSLVYILIETAFNESVWPETKQIFIYILTGTAFYHLWYVAMIIQLYLLFPFIQRAVLFLWRTLKPWQLTAGFWITAVGYVLLTDRLPFIVKLAESLSIPVFTPLFAQYSDRNALFFFIYFLMGAAAGLNVQVWKRRIMDRRVSWTWLYLVCGFGLFYNVVASFRTEHGFHIQYNHTLLLQPYMVVFLILSVIAMSIAAVWFQRYAGLPAKRLLTILGHYSYGAYLAHAMMLIAATYTTDRLFPAWNVALRTVIAFILCTLLSVLITVLFSRFRLGRLLTGAPAPLNRAA
jgi:surface polysaccharide O-acyltransferase-like enzyme